MAQRCGSAGRPRIFARLGHDSPIFSIGVLEMQHREPCGAERAVLLLRMLKDQQRNPVVDGGNAVAHAQRLRLATARAFVRCGVDGG